MLDDRKGCTSYCGDKVGIRPERGQPTPKERKLTTQMMRRAPFEKLDQVVNAKLRIDLNQKMHMIRHDFEFKNVCPVLRRHFADQFFESFIGAVHQDFTPIFWAPDDHVP